MSTSDRELEDRVLSERFGASYAFLPDDAKRLLQDDLYDVAVEDTPASFDMTEAIEEAGSILYNRVGGSPNLLGYAKCLVAQAKRLHG